MSDSIIDVAAASIRVLVQELEDAPRRGLLSLRLELLERAAWSVSLEPEARHDIVRIVQLLLDLRDEVVAARDAARAVLPRTMVGAFAGPRAPFDRAMGVT